MQAASLGGSSFNSSYIFLLYCPPNSNIAAVSCPTEQYFVASISYMFAKDQVRSNSAAAMT